MGGVTRYTERTNSKGGPTNLHNLGALCVRCNEEKGDMPLADYMVLVRNRGRRGRRL